VTPQAWNALQPGDEIKLTWEGSSWRVIDSKDVPPTNMGYTKMHRLQRVSEDVREFTDGGFWEP